MKKLSFILLFFPLAVFSQLNFDSLWTVWNDNSQADTSRLNAIRVISWEGYIFDQPDSAFYYAQIMYDFAEKKKEKKYMAIALNTQGASYYFKGEFEKSIEYWERTLEIFKEINEKKGVSNSLNNIAGVYLNEGNNAKAIEYYMQALRIKEEIGDELGIAKTLNNIGGVYLDQEEYEKAIEYFTKSLKIKEKIGYDKGTAGALSNIGNAYSYLGDYKKAMEFHSLSLKIREEMKDEKGISLSMNNIGKIFSNQGQYDSAMYYFNKSLAYRETTDDKKGIAIILSNIGMVYAEKDQYKKARDYSLKSLAIAQELGSVIVIRDNAELLWKVDKKLDKYNESLQMYELYIQMRDSIESEENKSEIIRQEYKYEYEKQATADSIKSAEEKKIQQAEIARKNTEIKAKEKEKQMLYGGLGLIALFSLFIFNRFRVTRKQNKIIEQQKKEVEKQKNFADEQRDKAREQQYLVEEKNKEILDSITYAKRIQSAILPSDKLIKTYLENSFVLYKPKDIVAGDFYWLVPLDKQNGVLFAAADCTGHGVPGAMVSVVCNNGLNRSVREYGVTDPAKILNKTRDIVMEEFSKSEEDVKDGMDLALCKLSKSGESTVLDYAGANNPLWIIRKGTEEVEEIKGDRQPVGKYIENKPFKSHSVVLNPEDTIYIFSDGYIDQFGGEKGKKFKSANFKRLLLSIQDQPMEKQQVLIDEAFEEWRGTIEQIDDVCVIGVRL